MTELWLLETTEYFWQKAGGFSLDLEFAAGCALPISLEKIPGLTTVSAWQWVASRLNIAAELAPVQADRPLRACLIALDDTRNFILLDENDTPQEQRFSLAHEIAHFLLDYLEPRRELTRYLPSETLSVLSGQRPPTLEERLLATLAGLTLRPQLHFMERDTAGYYASPETVHAEQKADRLAIELLAPFAQVVAAIEGEITDTPGVNNRRERIVRYLVQDFQLPSAVAAGYARQIMQKCRWEESFQEWLLR
jgi:hypothetical protein